MIGGGLGQTGLLLCDFGAGGVAGGRVVAAAVAVVVAVAMVVAVVAGAVDDETTVDLL